MDINSLLSQSVSLGCSDLHLAMPGKPMVRHRGGLMELPGSSLLAEADLSAVLEAITTEKQRLNFFETKELDLGYGLAGIGRFRVNACYQQGTISLSFRILAGTMPSLDDLGLPPICKELVAKPRGMVLVTGPTGSGKSTTLAAMIEYLNGRENRRIITIEDPIEYVYTPRKCQILQREIGSDSESFAAALRHVLRQDPDVVLVGEMRDLETISVALTAAETGHLVLSTLHTTSAPQTVDRIIDIFPPHQQAQVRMQLSTVLEAVLCQNLLPRAGGKGRVAAVEVLVATDAVRNLIREGKTYEIPNYIQVGRRQGMQSLDWSLGDLVGRGLVTEEEALSRANRPDELRRWLYSRA